MRRLLAAGSALGLLAHNAFETRAGVGLVFEPFLGRRGAVAMWAAYFPTGARRRGWARARTRAASPPSVPGSASPGVAVHFKAWPWSLHGGLPMLDEAEGLSEDSAPRLQRGALVLAASAARSACPPPTGPERGASPISGLLNFPILLASAQHHFEWARECRPSKTRSAGARPCAIRADGPKCQGSTGLSARRPVSLSFDNLGEAAELEMGACGGGAGTASDCARGGAGAARSARRSTGSRRPSSSRD